MSARIAVSNWKYSRLYNVKVHDKILANEGGRCRFPFSFQQISFHSPLERFNGFMLRFIEWAII